MKRLLLLSALILVNSAARAEFRQIDLTIYGMD